TTMFGFLACANAGVAASIKHNGNAANAHATFSINFMNILPTQNEEEQIPSTCDHCRRTASPAHIQPSIGGSHTQEVVGIGRRSHAAVSGRMRITSAGTTFLSSR